MFKRFTFASFSVVTFMCLSANAADPEAPEEASSPGWTEAEPEAAPPPAAEPAPEAKPEKKTTQTVTVKVSTSTQAEAERDKAPEPDAKTKKGVHEHDGFYLRMSLGGGSVNARGERTDAFGNRADYDFAGNAIAGDFMMGGTPARGLVIGGAYIFSHAAKSKDYSSPNADSGMSFGILGPFIDFYPDAKGGFHVGAAMGPAGTVTYDKDQEERVSAFGFGGSAWVGYDMWIGKQWSLGGILRASGARVETPDRMDDAPTEDRDRLGVGSIALLASITYH